jgi:hypothetical protein
MKDLVHYSLHFLFPLFVAVIFFRKDWKKVYFIFLGTMLVDLDHLFANPFFEPNRCSIQFHPLHTYYAMAVYSVMTLFKAPYRWIGIGLLMHMATDTIDCVWTYSICAPCLEHAPAEGLIQFIYRTLH